MPGWASFGLRAEKPSRISQELNDPVRAKRAFAVARTKPEIGKRREIQERSTVV